MNNIQKVIAQRQQKIKNQLKNDEILILFSDTNSHNLACPFNNNYQSNRNFYYLTGINKPNLIALFSHNCYQIFVPNYAQKDYQWQSDLFGQNQAKQLQQLYAYDQIHLVDQFEDQCKTQIKKQKIKKIICDLSGNIKAHSKLMTLFENYGQNKSRLSNPLIYKFIDVNAFFAPIRLYKSDSEIALMQKSAQIAAKAHNHLAQNLANFANEKDLAAYFSFYCAKAGAEGLAYPSIVAAAENGCILHYTENNKTIHNQDSILIDAGTIYAGYCSDITRTYPKSGKFTGAFKDLYQAVLTIQTQLIDELKNMANWQVLEERTIDLICQLLSELKLVNMSADSIREQKIYQDFYMHSAGHYLGLDVHDHCAYLDSNNQLIDFAAGMVFTIEPGIYIAKHLPVKEEFKGLAVRIEDDIALLTTKNNTFKTQVLSQDAYKKIEDIETIG